MPRTQRAIVRERGEAVRRIREHLNESCRVKSSLSDDLLTRIWQWAGACQTAMQRGNVVYFFGNGGSAADAQHLAAELVGRFRVERMGFPAVALTTNTSILTAVANDFAYENVFERQIEALARRGDIVVGITTSGKSVNVLKGLSRARAKGAITVVLCGKHTAKLKSICDILIDVPSQDSQRIQECHITIGHILCDLIEANYLSRHGR